MYPLVHSMRNLWILINYDKKTQDAAKWLANMSMYVSAIALSMSIAMAINPVTYLGFLFAHLVWSYFAWKIKDTALFWQFAFFIPIDLYAMYIRL